MSPTRVPAATLLLCASAAAALLSPSLGALLVFDRSAIDAGQWWRLATASLVHLSSRHFAWDGLALLLIGSAAEVRRPRQVRLVYLAAAWASGAAVYLAAPQLALFGGLSGIVTATLTALLLDLRSEGGVQGRWALAGLLMVAAKLAGEVCSGSSWLVATSHEPFVPVPASHLAGAAAAVLLELANSAFLRDRVTRMAVDYGWAAASPASSRTSASASGASSKPSVSAVSAATR